MQLQAAILVDEMRKGSEGHGRVGKENEVGPEVGPNRNKE
jgi:hypothetical protein